MVETFVCVFSVLVVGVVMYTFGVIFISILKGVAVQDVQVFGTQNAQERVSGESWGSGWSDGSISWDGGHDGGCDWGGGGDCGGGGDGGCGGDG